MGREKEAAIVPISTIRDIVNVEVTITSKLEIIVIIRKIPRKAGPGSGIEVSA
jgi:hypothetical protein